MRQYSTDYKGLTIKKWQKKYDYIDGMLQSYFCEITGGKMDCNFYEIIQEACCSLICTVTQIQAFLPSLTEMNCITPISSCV